MHLDINSVNYVDINLIICTVQSTRMRMYFATDINEGSRNPVAGYRINLGDNNKLYFHIINLSYLARQG